MRTKYFYLIIVMLVALNIIFYVTLLQNNRVEEFPPDNCQPIIDVMKAQFNNYLGWMVEKRIAYENRSFDSTIRLAASDGKDQPICELVKDTPVLVADFQKVHCQVCIFEEIPLLKNISKIIGKEKIIFLYDFASLRERIAFERNNGLVTYELSHQPKILSEEEVQPLVYMITQDLLIHDVFIPHRDVSGVSEAYYSLINDKYF
jgi:hypothetical protein